jgi:UPF0271 protein
LFVQTFSISPARPRFCQPAMRIDLNADVGESFGAHAIGHDAALFRIVTSASVAAGFHGGDPSTLRRTVRMALAAGVSIGAHPGFPDLAGFGRRELHVSAQEAEDLVLYQVAAVAGVAAAEGVRIRHVKPHGALYNMAARDRVVAGAIAAAVAAFDRDLILFAPPGSALLTVGVAAGLRVAPEGFADRAYEPDGRLASRHRPDAVLRDATSVVSQALRMAKEGSVMSLDGSVVPMRVRTICIHSDTPGADVLAAAVRSGLEAAGVTVTAAALEADPAAE